MNTNRVRVQWQTTDARGLAATAHGKRYVLMPAVEKGRAAWWFYVEGEKVASFTLLEDGIRHAEKLIGGAQ